MLSEEEGSEKGEKVNSIHESEKHEKNMNDIRGAIFMIENHNEQQPSETPQHLSSKGEESQIDEEIKEIKNNHG